jgi:hypothetical protein
VGDVTAAVHHYIDNVIRLSQSDISTSAASREWFLDRVISAIRRRSDADTTALLLYKPTLVYFGSYFKGTKVSVVDEYDVLLVIDTNHGVLSEDGTTTGHGQGVADPNPLFEGRYTKTDGAGVSPAKLLNWLQEVVGEVVDSFGGNAPIRNGQAVTARIVSKDITIDLVPAVTLTRVSDARPFYAIPSGDASGGWIATSPDEDKSRIAELAKTRQDFRNVIRILKRVRDCYNFKVTSFAIETDVASYAEQTSWTPFVGLEVRCALAHLARAFRSGSVTDPFDPSKNLLDGVASLDWYAERIDTIVGVMDSCAGVADQEQVRAAVYRAFENE